MTSLVVDASVALKWCVDEPGSAEAVAVHGRRLLAPDYLLVEVANVLCRKLRRGEATVPQVRAAMQTLPDAFDLLAPAPELLTRAVELAVALQHPVYDCLYLALAERENAEMVTDDAKLLAKGVAAQVKVVALRG